jgi:hypothetical protein
MHIRPVCFTAMAFCAATLAASLLGCAGGGGSNGPVVNTGTPAATATQTPAGPQPTATPTTVAVVSAATVQTAPGSTVPVCVSLANNMGQIAGVQTDLSWDPNCVSPVVSGGFPVCRPNPSTGKDATPTMINGTSFTVLVFSITDLNPVPNGQIFCCDFLLVQSPPTPCCTIGVGNVRGSTARGGAITNIEGVDGQVCASP